MDESPKSGASACGVCPFDLLPKGSLERLIKRPFRKRHPVIFWISALLLTIIGLSVFASFLGDKEDGAGRESIALINVTGPITNVEPTLEWIRRIGANDWVKGVLLRVDSPGGGASASQELYAALLELAQKKPMVVSMGATAASGGLMVSMAGKRVFANAATLTGSIGVRMDIPQLQGLMGKIGVAQETLVSGPYKDAASITRPLDAEDRRYLQELVMKLHGQFVDIVAQGRKLPREKVLALATGKVYTGQEALELGLVDAIGGQEKALEWLAKECGVPASQPLLKRKISKTRLVERLLENSQSGSLEQALQWLLTLWGQLSPGEIAQQPDRPLIYY